MNRTPTLTATVHPRQRRASGQLASVGLAPVLVPVLGRRPAPAFARGQATAACRQRAIRADRHVSRLLGLPAASRARVLRVRAAIVAGTYLTGEKLDIALDHVLHELAGERR